MEDVDANCKKIRGKMFRLVVLRLTHCFNFSFGFVSFLFHFMFGQKSAILTLTRLCPGQKTERLFIDWCWWTLGALPFPHLVRVIDCYLHEGIKVLYRVTLAILIIFNKHSQSASSDSEWSAESLKNDIDNALPRFCKSIPVTPAKLLRTAFSIRNLR